MPMDPHQPGAKLDDDKIDLSLLEYFPYALEEVCRVAQYGQAKYTRNGWRSVPDGINRYTAAMWRHFFAKSKEGRYDRDPSCAEYGYENRILHDAQVAWNALARLELILEAERNLEQAKQDKYAAADAKQAQYDELALKQHHENRLKDAVENDDLDYAVQERQNQARVRARRILGDALQRVYTHDINKTPPAPQDMTDNKD